LQRRKHANAIFRDIGIETAGPAHFSQRLSDVLSVVDDKHGGWRRRVHGFDGIPGGCCA
jgi:hypothetical protein